MRTPPIARRLLAVLAIATFAGVIVAVAACGGSGDEGTGATTGSETPKQGGSLTVSFLTEPESLDPAIAYNVIDWQIEHEVFEGLLRYPATAGKEGTTLEPALATEVPSVENGGLSEDGLTYTFHLRKGVKFQPPVGREVTAQDFKYSFERMLSLPRMPVPDFYTGVVGAQEFRDGKADEVSGYKVVDDYTIEITLKAPDLAFLNCIAMEFGDVMPKEWVDQWGNQVNRHPLGTGRMMFVSWTPGQEIVLKRNPNYWVEGRPYLDEIKYALSYNPQTAFLKLQRGEVDALGDGVPPAELVRVQNDPEWKDYVHSQPLIAISYLFLNAEMPPFDNPKVREAICWAVDRDKLVKLQAGQAQSLYQYYPPGMPGYVEGKQYFGYDPDKAKQILADAGYPDGFETMLYTDNVDPNPKLMTSVQNDLKAIGIKAKLQTMSNDTYYTMQGTPKTLTMGSFGWWMDFPDPSDWILPLFSKSSAVEGGMNSSFWWSQELEDAYAAAQNMTDPQARIEAFSKMQDIIAADAAYAPLYSLVQTTMSSKNVGGFYLHPVYQIDPGSYWRK
jgi:peptide/nickel transport system substrate-binding protein